MSETKTSEYLTKLEKENAELRKKIEKTVTMFQEAIARETELESRWEKLIDKIDYHKNGLCSCKTSLECLMRLSKESGGEVGKRTQGVCSGFEAPAPVTLDGVSPTSDKKLDSKKEGVIA